MNKNANSLEHPQKEREELWHNKLPKRMDWKNITINGMDTNKDKIHSGNP